MLRTIYPVGVLRHRLLHRNGNLVPPAPWTPTRRRVKTGFRWKTGRGRAFYESIRKVPTGETTEPLVTSIRLFPSVFQNRPFFGPSGSKMENHFCTFTQKEQRAGWAGCTQVTLFPYDCWVFEEKNAIWACHNLCAGELPCSASSHFIYWQKCSKYDKVCAEPVVAHHH